MIIIMQRLHQNDPSALFLEKQAKAGRQVRHISLPGEIRTPRAIKLVKPRRLVKFYKNGLLDPVRLTAADLREFEEGLLGEYGYAGQILQSPVPLGGGQFKTDRIEIDEPGPLRHFKQLVRYWDKAGTKVKVGSKIRRAWSVGVLMGIGLDDRFWVLNVIRFRLDSFEREKIIKQTAQADGISVEVVVEQEPGSGGKESAERTVRELAGFNVYVDRPVGDKEARAQPFSIQVNGGNVRMQAGDWNMKYLDELRYFPGTYKDQVDASSGAFARLTYPRQVIGGMW
jgi:predicted phage terminase large subunit-like protein